MRINVVCAFVNTESTAQRLAQTKAAGQIAPVEGVHRRRFELGPEFKANCSHHLTTLLSNLPLDGAHVAWCTFFSAIHLGCSAPKRQIIQLLNSHNFCEILATPAPKHCSKVCDISL